MPQQTGKQKIKFLTCSDRSRVPHERRAPYTGRRSKQVVLIEAGGFYPNNNMYHRTAYPCCNVVNVFNKLVTTLQQRACDDNNKIWTKVILFSLALVLGLNDKILSVPGLEGPGLSLDS